MINLGNFGFSSVERPDAMAPVRQPSRGQALSQLGQIVGNVNDVLQAERDELNKARGATLQAEAKVQANAIRAGIIERVRAGEIKPEDMIGRFREETKAWQESILADKDESLKKLVAGPMGDFFKVTEIGVFDASQAKIRDGFEAEMVTSRGALEQAALIDPAGSVTQMRQIYDAIGPKAGWDKAKIEAAKQTDAERFYTSSKLNWAGQEESIANLKAEEAKLSDDSYLPELGGSRVRYRDYVQTRIRELKAAKEARTREWEQTTEIKLRQFRELMENGSDIPAGVQDDLAQFRQSVRGTKYGKVLADIERENSESRKFALMPADQQVKALEKTQAQALAESTDPQRAVEMKAKTERQTALVARNIGEMRKDPGAYVERVHGITPQPLDFDRDMTVQLAGRDQWRAQVQARTGINPGLLRPTEADQLAQVMNTLPAIKQEEMFKAFAKTDQSTQKATLAQIGKVDPLKMAAGVHTLAGHTARVGGVDGRPVGRMLLDGGKLLAEKQIHVEPKTENKVKAKVAEYIGPALAHDPDEFAAVTPMVMAFLAFRAKDKNSLTLSADDDEIINAVDIVTGGKVLYNESATILPYGMKAGEFAEKAPVAIANTLRSLGYKPEQTNKMRETITLRQADEPYTYFLYNGRDAVPGPDGPTGLPAKVRIR